MTIETAASRIVAQIRADTADLRNIGKSEDHNNQTIFGWSQRIVAQIECLAILIGRDDEMIERLDIQLGLAIIEAKVNLHERDCVETIGGAA